MEQQPFDHVTGGAAIFYAGGTRVKEERTKASSSVRSDPRGEKPRFRVLPQGGGGGGGEEERFAGEDYDTKPEDTTP